MTDRWDSKLENVCFIWTGRPGDAGAFQRTLRLCHSAGATLTVVGIVDEPPRGLARLLTSLGVSVEAITDAAAVSHHAKELAEVAQSQGVNASAKALRGPGFAELRQDALRMRYDLVIKTADPIPSMGQALLGRSDRQLIRKSPCAVWIEKPSSGTSQKRILAAVDPAPFQEDAESYPLRAALDGLIIKFARLLSTVEAAELHVAHVWQFDLEGSLRLRAGLGDDDVAQVEHSIQATHQEALDGLLEPHDQFISRTHLLKGHAGEEIVRLAAEQSVDTVVMGTRCRTGLSAFLLGNTAETVLDRVNCSVLTVKIPARDMPSAAEE